MINDEMIRYLIQKGYKWIVEQRNFHIESAQGLSEQDIASLQPYFEPKILDLARTALVEHIENPPFYPEIAGLGIPNLIDFTDMAGITFVDCILMSSRITHDQQSRTSLLFHEMVHVVQYDLLAAKRFAELYVTGWAENGFDYRSIPLESQAYDLERQFNQGGTAFSVAQVLKREFGGIG